MERLIIKGGNQLHGDVYCSGAKNAGLPIIAATILLEKTIEIENCASDYTNTVKQKGFLCKCPPDYLNSKNCNGEINTNYCYPKPTATGKYCNLFNKDSNARKRLQCYRSGEKCTTQKV